MLSPRVTADGPVLRIFKSKTGSTPTVVVTVDVSSPGVSSPGTLAVLMTVPTLVGWTLTVMAALVAPGASVPTLQVIVVAVLVQFGVVAETNVVSAGMSSVKVALGTEIKPVFFTVIV